jgi:lipoprotein-releasing system permease protein
VSGAVLRGILPVEEDQVADLRQDMLSGSADDLIAGSFNIVLGQELAAVLGVGVGDKVTVVTPQISATPVGIMPRLKAFNVTGLFAVGMSDYDRGAAFLNLKDAAKLMSLGDGVPAPPEADRHSRPPGWPGDRLRHGRGTGSTRPSTTRTSSPPCHR